MMTLVASPKGNPFCRPSMQCNMAKKGAKTLCFTISHKTHFVFEGNFPSTSTGGGAYIRRGNFTEGFLCYKFGGLIHGGAYFRNFTVVLARDSNMAAYQQFQMRILNEILFNFWVSACNELGKVWEETEEENPVPVAKTVKGTSPF